MKIPEKIKIIGKMIDVKIVKNKELPNLNGQFQTQYNLIHLNEDVEPQQLEETLLHEIIEFIETQLELKIEHKSICALSECLYQVLKDNNLYFGEEIEGGIPGLKFRQGSI